MAGACFDSCAAMFLLREVFRLSRHTKGYTQTGMIFLGYPMIVRLSGVGTLVRNGRRARAVPLRPITVRFTGP